MTAWLEFAPQAFDRKARPVAPALFGRDEALGRCDDALFDMSGEPVADAIALSPARRAELEVEREALLARLSDIDAMLNP